MEGIIGYTFDYEEASLILHKTNMCDSIVMIKDHRSPEYIDEQMKALVKIDDRWSSIQINERDIYREAILNFSYSMQTNQHFRPVCEINGGDYDYMFIETTDHGDIYGGLVDVETGTIAMYIFLY